MPTTGRRELNMGIVGLRPKAKGKGHRPKDLQDTKNGCYKLLLYNELQRPFFGDFATHCVVRSYRNVSGRGDVIPIIFLSLSLSTSILTL